MKGCSVCGSSEEHFDGANCVDHLLARLVEAEKRAEKWKKAYSDSMKESVQDTIRAEDAESRLWQIEGRARYWLEHEEEVRAKISDYAALESRLRDAEARVEELSTGIQDAIDLLTNANPEVCMCGGEMSRHSMTDSHPPTSMLGYYSDIWITEAKERLATTTGAFDRLRDQVLEEAAGIIMEQYATEKDGLNNCHALDALYHAREAIRTAKKGER